MTDRTNFPPTPIDQLVIDELNALVELNSDAVEAYEAAIERVDDVTCKDRLTEFMGDHRRYIDECQTMVTNLGGKPKAEGRSFNHVLTKGRVVIRSIAGDTQIMKAMRSNENDTNERYEMALERLSAARAELRQLVARHLSDARRHRAWIQAWIERH